MTDSRLPLVSVVIPTYDRPALLRRSVRSVDSQTYSEIELIVVDGPSDTPAESVIEELDLSFGVHYIRHSELQGVSAARNAGIDRANGEYIAFLDDDDEWRPTKPAKQVDRIQNRPAGVVYTGIEQVGADGKTNAVKTESIEGNILPSILRRDFIGSPSCVLIRTDVIDAVSGFDEELSHWEDWDLYLTLASDWEFGAVSQPLVRRHTHDDQASADITRIEEVAAHRIFQKHRDLARDVEGWSTARFKGSIEFYIAESSFTNDLFDTARSHLLNTIRAYPYEPKWYLYLLLVSGGAYTFRPAQLAKRAMVRILR